MYQLATWLKLSLFVLLVIAICYLLFYDFGKSATLLSESITNLGHIPIFAVVAGMSLWVLDREKWIHAGIKTYMSAFAISVGLSLATEFVQSFMPNRSFQKADIVSDIIGSGAFLLVAYQHQRGLPRRTRVFLSCIAVVSLVVVSLPMLRATAVELRAIHDYPLLASFETSIEINRWQAVESSFERVDMHSTNGKSSLKVLLCPGLYSGINFGYPPLNWHVYDNLAFDVFLDGNKPLVLTVRINDLAHNGEYDDRYNRSLTLKPGQNRMIISLAEVERAPKIRKMDLGRISSLCIFSYKLKEQRIIYLDNFRLEK